VLYLLKRGRVQDAAGSLTLGQAVHAAVLYITGGIFAIGLLVAGFSITSYYFPHTTESFRRFADSVFWPDDEPTLARVPVTLPARAPSTEAPLPLKRSPKRVVAMRLPVRQFALPPAPELPIPVLHDDTPIMLAAVAAEPALAPFETEALPERPPHPVLKVFAVLAQPFRALAGLFAGRNNHSSW
jgi:hypothetical protein